MIGYGSIGQRHARLLTELKCQVAIMSLRSIDFAPRYSDLNNALSDWQPEYVVVANRSNEHYQAIHSLARQGFQGRVLIE